MRSVVEGPMLFVRFGTCGGLRADVPEGTVVVASHGAVRAAPRAAAFFWRSKGQARPFTCVFPQTERKEQAA